MPMELLNQRTLPLSSLNDEGGCAPVDRRSHAPQPRHLGERMDSGQNDLCVPSVPHRGA